MKEAPNQINEKNMQKGWNIKIIIILLNRYGVLEKCRSGD